MRDLTSVFIIDVNDEFLFSQIYVPTSTIVQEIIQKLTILISNELKSMNQIIEKDENNGRYLQIKISPDNETKESIIHNNIYVEPDQENNNQIIPESIWTKEHIVGDMNNMRTGFTKDSGVYHINNMGKK